MVTGAGLGLGNKMLKQDRLGLCVLTGTDLKGKTEQRCPAKNGTRYLRMCLVSLI